MIELVKRAKNGDREAFTDLVILYQSELFKIARAKLINYLWLRLAQWFQFLKKLCLLFEAI